MNNYSNCSKCFDCGVFVSNYACRCSKCNNRYNAAKRRGLTVPQYNKYRQSQRESEFNLRFVCEQCGGKRSNKSRRFCGACYSAMRKANFNVPANTIISPWEILADGTLMRTVTGGE